MYILVERFLSSDTADMSELELEKLSLDLCILAAAWVRIDDACEVGNS